jgi:dihydroorotate dehydrogenase electron transfer subunit
MLSAGACTAVDRTDPLLPRPMAIYRCGEATDGSGELEILYKRTGRGTVLLSEALPGQRVRMVGPLGRPFPSCGAEGRAILVGGGTGVASLLALAGREQATRSAGRPPVQVLLGAAGQAELAVSRDFEALGVELHLTTEDGSVGARGLVTEPLEEVLAREQGATTVYACGPTPMMERCAEIAAKYGARCIVSLENNMACGFGVCLGCAAPVNEGGYALVCRDGPVFDAREIRWSELP